MHRRVESMFQNHIRLGKTLLHIPFAHLDVLEQIPFFVQGGRPGLAGLDRVADDRQLLEFHLDQVHGFVGDFLGLGSHNGKRVPNVTDALSQADQDRPIVNDQAVILLSRQILCRQDGPNPGQTAGLLDIQPLQDPMRDAGPPDTRKQHAIECQVIREFCIPGDLVHGIRTDLGMPDNLLVAG